MTLENPKIGDRVCVRCRLAGEYVGTLVETSERAIVLECNDQIRRIFSPDTVTIHTLTPNKQQNSQEEKTNGNQDQNKNSGNRKHEA